MTFGYKHHDNNSYATVPGNIQLSQKFLKPFIRELGFFKRNYNEIYSEPGRLEEHLAFGAANAAKVVTIDNEVIVAALSTDIDAAILLKFNKNMAKKFNLNPGDKLLSVNTYGSFENTAFRQKDLLEGPNSTGLYSICYPIIADFITEDTKALQTTKDKLPKDEWKSLDKHIDLRQREVFPFVRNGNPYLSVEAPVEKK